MEQDGADVRVQDMQHGYAEHGVHFVYFAVGGHPQIEFSETSPVAEGGFPLVAGARVDFVELHVELLAGNFPAQVPNLPLSQLCGALNSPIPGDNRNASESILRKG